MLILNLENNTTFGQKKAPLTYERQWGTKVLLFLEKSGIKEYVLQHVFHFLALFLRKNFFIREAHTIAARARHELSSHRQ